MNMVIQSLEYLLLTIEYKHALIMLFYFAHTKFIHITDMNVLSALDLCEYFCTRVIHT